MIKIILGSKKKISMLKIEDILQSFYEISGMDIAIVNKKNKIIARRYSGALYCSHIHRSPKCMEMCLESDRCGIIAATDKRDLHVYKCPFGIYEALMPIYKNDDIVAYIFVGMGIEDSEESFKQLMNSVLDVSPNLNKKQLESSIGNLPRYSKEKLEAFSILLPMIAEYIETNNLLVDNDMTIGQLIKTYIKNNLATTQMQMSEIETAFVRIGFTVESIPNITREEYILAIETLRDLDNLVSVAFKSEVSFEISQRIISVYISSGNLPNMIDVDDISRRKEIAVSHLSEVQIELASISSKTNLLINVTPGNSHIRLTNKEYMQSASLLSVYLYTIIFY